MEYVDLDGIEARANAASPAEFWAWEEIAEFMPGGDAYGLKLAHLNIDAHGDNTPGAAADRDFIAAVRADVPALVAEVRRLTDERDHWRRVATAIGKGERTLMPVFMTRERAATLRACLSLSEVAKILDKAGKPAHWLTDRAEDDIRTMLAEAGDK